jgi:hypothetical protein
MKEAGDVKRASETVEALQHQVTEIDELVTSESQEIAARSDSPLELDRVPLAPKRGQVSVQFVALGWDPS